MDTQPNLLTEMREVLKSPIIVGIAGDSGSGKTTYTNGIRRLFGANSVRTIEMDGYHTENREMREKTGHLPLDPGINNLDLLQDQLRKLKKNESVMVPIYNHSTGNFDEPKQVDPAPIIIIEGLHALYPEFQQLLDFSLYVDPSREVKWSWKYKRDKEVRGHEDKKLLDEMHKREAAYKRWIDFQKTSANIVIKINKSHVQAYARYEPICQLPDNCYQMELIMEQPPASLPTIELPLNLATMIDSNMPAFLIAAVPSVFWGKRTMNVIIDGLLSETTAKTLEQFITSSTGIPLDEALEGTIMERQSHEQMSSTQFAQLLVVWRFLEHVEWRISEEKKTYVGMAQAPISVKS
jgi:phosphoribulokinase